MHFYLYMFTLLQLCTSCRIMKIFMFFVTGADLIEGESWKSSKGGRRFYIIKGMSSEKSQYSTKLYKENV